MAGPGGKAGSLGREAKEMAERVEAVKRFLQAEFPGARIEVIRDAQSGRAAVVYFDVDDAEKAYALEVSEEFLDDLAPDQLGEELRRRGTGAQLRCSPRPQVVLLTTHGFAVR